MDFRPIKKDFGSRASVFRSTRVSAIYRALNGLYIPTIGGKVVGKVGFLDLFPSAKEDGVVAQKLLPMRFEKSALGRISAT